MSATVEGHDERNGVVALRWAACFGLVLAVHFGVALFILDHVTASAEPPAGAPPPDAVMLDLPSEASTPPADPAKVRSWIDASEYRS